MSGCLLALQTHAEEDGEPLAIDLPDIELTGHFTDSRLQATGRFADDDLTVTANATLAPVSVTGNLAGHLDISATELAGLRAFDQRLQEVTGLLGGRLELAGTPQAPTLQGQLQISGGQLKLENPDLALQDLGLALTLDDSGTFALQATARQAGSVVKLQGSGSELFLPSRRLAAQIMGDGLTAEHPSWRVVASPNLTFDYARQRGHLAGTLAIPEANVRINVLPTTAPRLSPDVTVVGREDKTNTSELRVTADIRVTLGDAVELKAVGVTARLAGELRARRDARNRTSLHGELQVAGGVLAAQGQSLEIESGVVRYDGPIEDPYLDVRAARTIDTQTPTVKVGVHIRGRADSLVSTIYSEPPMSDTRALSFLVLGRDFDESSSEDGNQLMSAAINLGLRSSNGIVADVRRAIGLDELSAMAESQNSFAIVAGKRIGPSLYVRYTYDTLAALGALLVRYNLSKRWHLEAQTSDSSAMDLFYSIEK